MFHCIVVYARTAQSVVFKVWILLSIRRSAIITMVRYFVTIVVQILCVEAKYYCSEMYVGKDGSFLGSWVCF